MGPTLFWQKIRNQADNCHWKYDNIINRPFQIPPLMRWLGAFCDRNRQISAMKSIRLIFPVIAFLFVSTGIVGAVETNGFLVFEIGRFTYPSDHTNGSEIKQKFKIPLTEEFMSNFKNVPNQNGGGTGFCCQGGSLRASEGSTSFLWWIRKTADNHWSINMWGEGVETLKGVRMNSRNPKTSQSVTIKRWEDLDMSYMQSYSIGGFGSSGSNPFGGMNISFTAKYVSAKDIEADGYIPAAPVQKADHTVLFKGDDSSNLPLEINCLFQE